MGFPSPFFLSEEIMRYVFGVQLRLGPRLLMVAMVWLPFVVKYVPNGTRVVMVVVEAMWSSLWVKDFVHDSFRCNRHFKADSQVKKG